SLAGIATSYGTTALPHIMHLTLEGPYHPVGISDTPSRKRIFTCRPIEPKEEIPCAKEIVSRLAGQAYGQKPTDDDLESLMAFYALGSEDGGFESGVRAALEAILASPRFLFRTEVEPAGLQPGDVYELADIDLATRLSFFLWGTHPDEELLELARKGKLSRDSTLRR